LRLLAPILALTVVVPVCASAQRLSLDFPAWRPHFVANSSVDHHVARANLQTKFPDYRLEGTVLGVVLLGGLGLWMGTEVCNNQPQPVGSGGGSSCSALPFALVGVAVGGGVGYVLGRITSKHPRSAA